MKGDYAPFASVVSLALAVALTICMFIGYRAEASCRQQGKVYVTSPRDGSHACLSIVAMTPAR